jgi:predicted nucleotidyltransferase
VGVTPDLRAVQELLEQDDRVLALFVTGSHADGRADEHSDLDLLVVTDDTDVQDLAARLPVLVDEIETLVP